MPRVSNVTTSTGWYGNSGDYRSAKRGRPISLKDFMERTTKPPNANFYPRHTRHPRSAWVLSTKSWLWAGKSIVLYVNPKDVSWTFPRRETVEKTLAGTVRNAWRNSFRSNRYFDEPTLSVTFQSGSIIPSMGYTKTLQNDPFAINGPDQGDLGIPPGLLNWYDFLEMCNQSALSGPWENYHIIGYRSRAYPQILIQGYWDPEGLTMPETSDDGNQISWQARFIVYKTQPNIFQSSAMFGAYHDWVWNRGGWSEVRPEAPAQPDTQPGVDVRRIGTTSNAGAFAPIPDQNESTPEQQALLDAVFQRLDAVGGLGPIPRGQTQNTKTDSLGLPSSPTIRLPPRQF